MQHVSQHFACLTCGCMCVFEDWWKKEREGCFNAHTVKHNIVVLVCAWWYMSMWTRMGNQSCFGTLQEVINSQDYCADRDFKGAPQQLVRQGLIEPEHLKGGERCQVRSILSRPICLSLYSCRHSPLWEGKGLNIKEQPCYLGDRNN